MTDSYVSAKVAEALQACDGNKREAQKLLLTWAVRDHALLLGMTKPHLKAIVTTWVDHEARPAKKSGKAEADTFSRADINEMIAARPLGEKRSASVPPPKSSIRQASAMQKIADAFKKK